MTVVAFLIAPTRWRSINVDVLRARAMFIELREECDRIAGDIGRKLLQQTAGGVLPPGGELLDADSVIRLKRILQARRSGRLPIICTYDLVDDEHDDILCQLRACGLLNHAEDRVKVVFHPAFLQSTDPILGLEYDQFVRGCHLGVFPSCYEPWGYTPMECLASGIPAVTSDLSGFGAYLRTHVRDHQAKGMYVLRRRGVGFEQASEELAGLMESFCGLSRRQRVVMRNEAENMAQRFDWAELAVHYNEAHALALQRHAGTSLH